MVSPDCYSSTNDERQHTRPYPLYTSSSPEQYFPLASHDSRAINMTGQLDSDSAPQRKRIAVACGRCRKRKIRCSGDPGQGQPCSNCKNAGVEQCQFLRVSSREAPLRHDSADFLYSVGDARVYASRTPVTHGIPYSNDVSALGTGDVLTSSYRGGSTYPYTPATKTYYPALHAYGTAYPDAFEFGLGVSSPPGMHPEPVSMIPGAWNCTSRSKQQPFGSMYLDSPDGGTFGGYGGVGGLLHRPSPHSASADSPSFSFSGVATADRMLPNPTARSSTLPHPSSSKPSTPASATSTASTLVDVATAASYVGGFPNSGLSFCSGSSISSHFSSPSRSNSDGYSGQESIFSEQERSTQSQGPAFDMSGYTASPRRSSGLGSGAGVSMTGHHHTYISDAGTHDATARPSHQHRHQQHQHSPLPTAYMADAPSSPVAHRHGQTLLSGGDGTSHTIVAAHSADDDHIAMTGQQ